MKNAYDLLQKMGNTPIEYGLWDKIHERPLKGNQLWKVNGTDEIDTRCVVMKPEDVWKRKLGTCWDCTLLEYEEFKKMGYKNFKAVYFEAKQPNGSIGTTHSFLMYQENGSKDWWWFEYTWYKVCGLHGPYVKDKELFEAVTLCQKATDPTWEIVYWNKDFDAQKLLDMDEIRIMDFVYIVNPSAFKEKS